MDDDFFPWRFVAGSFLGVGLAVVVAPVWIPVSLGVHAYEALHDRASGFDSSRLSFSGVRSRMHFGYSGDSTSAFYSPTREVMPRMHNMRYL